jgi:flagellar hook-associated protein 3 FlgL
MTFANVSSNYLATAMAPAVRQTQAQIANLQIESSTGEYANLGLQLGSQSGYELSLRTQDDLLQALSTSNSVVASNMTSSQNALSSLLSAAQSTASSLASTTSSSDNAFSLQNLGQNSLQQFISVANTTAAGGYLFGGQNSATAPVDDYFASPTSSAKTAVDTAFTNYFGFPTTSPNVANITSTQMQGFLSGPFASLFQSPSWTTNWSNASDDNVTTEIAPGDTVQTSTNANTAGFQQLAQGYAMLTEFANIGLGSGAQQAVISAATTTVNSGVSSLIKTQASLGLAQDRVTQANSAISSQMTTLQAQINKMDNVDPSQIATQLTALSTQLETAYQLTSQIHNLNLAQYLPT